MNNVNDVLKGEIDRENKYYKVILKRVQQLLNSLEKDSQKIGKVRTSHAQSRLESEALLNHKQARHDKLWFAQDKLLFGKLEMSSGECYYIGKTGVSDEQHSNLLIDWRAPIAVNYYQSTHVNNMGVDKKRTIKLSQGAVVNLYDEVFVRGENTTPIIESEESQLINELNRSRTGKMGEIVSTLQAEQDRIMRIAESGPLIIDGPPGTGKTVIALHRAAYLLYNNRDKIKNKGVLVIGPNKQFLEYIDNVLPSLGEDEVNLNQTTDLVLTTNQLRASRNYLKSGKVMARILEEIVSNLPHIEPKDVTLDLFGDKLVFGYHELAQLLNQARHQQDKYNEIREVFLSEVLKLGVEKLIVSRELEEVDDLEKFEMAQELRESTEFRRAVNLLYMPFTPERLLYKLSSDEAFLKNVAGRYFNEAKKILASDADYYKFEEYEKDDLFILDFLYEFLGPADVRYVDEPEWDWNQTQLTINDKIYAHIIVDEAQELTYLEWVSLSNRLGLKSMTIVGDWGQKSATSDLNSWEEVLQIFGKRTGRIEKLNINYRTPKKIMDFALKIMEDKYIDREIVSLRDLPESLNIIEVNGQDQLVKLLSKAPSGSAIIGGVYLNPLETKGLEYDHVYLINPKEMVKEFGREAYFVALTRATQSLTIIELM